jgi:hypothetical protein
MLHGTVAFLVLVAFALVGSELRGRLARRGLQAPAMEGLSFLLVGIALGEQGLGLFADDVLASLRVVVLIGLAWIGLVFGLQVEWKVIRQLRPWHRLLGWLVPLVFGAVVVTGAALLGLGRGIALGLAAIAMAGSPSTIEEISRGRRPADRSALRLLKLVTAYSGLPAVLVFGLASAVGSPVTTAAVDGLPWWQLMVLMAGFGCVAGYLVLALVRGIGDRIGILTMLTGTMAGVAGASALLGVSGLPAAAVAGAVIINRGTFPHRMLRVAHSLERPMLVALLVLVGASWRGAAFSWPVLGLMVLGRWLSAAGGGGVIAAFASRRGIALGAPAIGLGLLPQGELAVGLTVALVGFVAGTEGVLEAVVVSVVCNQLLGQWWLRQVLFGRRFGETP